MSASHARSLFILGICVLSALRVFSPDAAEASAITKMAADLERPYIYALKDRAWGEEDTLLVISVESENVVKSFPIGLNATDLTISVGDDRLYVNNWHEKKLQVVDLVTQSKLAPLVLGLNGDTYKINAGIPGRIYVEEDDQWVDLSLMDTATGVRLGRKQVREGDGETDPTGTYYYHCDNSSTGATIQKYRFDTDRFTLVSESPVHGMGSRNLIMSPDGSRFFWQGFVFDADLNELGFLDQEIYATTIHGDLAFTESTALEPTTGEVVATLPFNSTVMTVSGDGQKLFATVGSAGNIEAVLISDLAPVASPGVNPVPADQATVLPPLSQLQWAPSPLGLRYQVYFGTDETAVGTATPASPEYLGEVVGNQIALPAEPDLGVTRYWRVDVVGFTDTMKGDVWSFTVAPMEISETSVAVSTPTLGGAPRNHVLILTAAGGAIPWSATTMLPWLSLDRTSGSTPDSLVLSFDATGLLAGTHEGTIAFVSGAQSFSLPVSLTTFEMSLSQMVTDYDRPYIYALHPGTGAFHDARLLFINTETELVEHVLPIGKKPTDMSIHTGLQRLYVTNNQQSETRVVDLNTQSEISPLLLGTDVHKINAGPVSRLYYETRSLWPGVHMVSAVDGTHLASLNTVGNDAELDPGGEYYYHTDDWERTIVKYSVASETFVDVGRTAFHVYGSWFGPLILTPDGSRLFWRGRVTGSDLVTRVELGEDIYATSSRGDLAFGTANILNATNGEVVSTLPISSTVKTLSADQQKLFFFSEAAKRHLVIPTDEIIGAPSPSGNPEPASGSTKIATVNQLSWEPNPLAFRYRVYFGLDEAAVAAADDGSPEYVGEIEQNFIDPPVTLNLGETYYWRVDAVGFSSTAKGPVWSFTVAPIVVIPREIEIQSLARGAISEVELELTTDTVVRDWSVAEDLPWLQVEEPSGTTPSTVRLLFDISELSAGEYQGEVEFTSGLHRFVVPVRLDLEKMVLTQMATDPNRPYIYGLHPGSGSENDAYLVFINTDLGQVDHMLPIGRNPTDMAVHREEDRLYVTNWGTTETRVIDLSQKLPRPPIHLGSDVYRINAGRQGKIITEGSGYNASVRILDSSNGFVRDAITLIRGNGDSDPTGSFYFHCAENGHNVGVLKFDISADRFTQVAASPTQSNGSANQVLSLDGSKLFWRANAHDSDLNQTQSLRVEIYSTTSRGQLAFGSSNAYKVIGGARIYDLPLTTQISAVSSDDEKLVLYDPTTGGLQIVPMTDIAGTPTPTANPAPTVGATVLLPLTEMSWDQSPSAYSYDVYLGSDSTAVALAERSSPEFVGTVEEGSINPDLPLDLATTYYWRVDAVGIPDRMIGEIWSFTTAPILVSPNQVATSGAVSYAIPPLDLELSADTGAQGWSITGSPSWLSIDQSAGTTPATLRLSFDATSLTAGTHEGLIAFTSGLTQFEVPVTLKLFDLALTQMAADYERPYIYALHDAGPYSWLDDGAFLLFINTETDQLERMIPIGDDPTDMAVHQAEGRLYVTNRNELFVRIVDLESQIETDSLELGIDAYRVNAGNNGWIIAEQRSGDWIKMFRTDTGELLASTRQRAGDGDLDPTRRFYYHSDQNISSARVHKYDVSGGSFVSVASGPRHYLEPETRLVTSADGSALFWKGYVYDNEIVELDNYAQSIYATTFRGEVAFGYSEALDVATGEAIYEYPDSGSTVMAVSGDQSKLYRFNRSTHRIDVISMSEIRDIQPPGLLSDPPDGGSAILPLSQLAWEYHPSGLQYRVFFGMDEAAVAAAEVGSAEYLGQVVENFIPLPVTLSLRETYYWRVDVVGFSDTRRGPVWSFTVPPIVVTPREIEIASLARGAIADIELVLTTDVGVEDWSVTATPPWLSVDMASGSTPATIRLSFDISELAAGEYRDEVSLTSGTHQFAVPVHIELEEMRLTQMAVDPQRPYIYGLHPGSGNADDAFLVFINTDLEQVDRVMPIGRNPTDMTVHREEDRLYVTNWGTPETRVVDLKTRIELPPLSLGTDVHRINSGKLGTIIVEGTGWRIAVRQVATHDGSTLGTLPNRYEGDGETDPTGRYYYRAEDAYGNSKLRKYYLPGDGSFVEMAASLYHGGSRHVVMSGDGLSLFWRSYLFDADVNQLGNLGQEIFASTLHGEFAFGDNAVISTRNGGTVYTLPVATEVIAIAADQEKVVLFDESAGDILVVPMSEIGEVAGPGLNPDPEPGSTVVPPLAELEWDIVPGALKYTIYFGTDPTAVANAVISSPEFLGITSETEIPLDGALDLGQSYYWRIDVTRRSSLEPGEVLGFTVAPIVVNPGQVDVVAVTSSSVGDIVLQLSSEGSAQSWSVASDVPWLSIDRTSGSTPENLTLSFDTSALVEGVFEGALEFTADTYTFAVPVNLELIRMSLSQMAVDYERPYIYGLHPGAGRIGDAYVMFINTETEQVERVLPIGRMPTDMTIHVAEDLLYVTNWGQPETRIVDLEAKAELEPLLLGADVYKINAGRSGRIYYEEEDQWIEIKIIDSATGGEITSQFSREGDGELDPSGTYYYHCDNNSSGAKLHKYDVSADTFVELALSPNHSYGSRNLVMSGDGSRLFWQGYVYDPALIELTGLGEEVMATSRNGALAITNNRILNSDNGDEIFGLPFGTPVSSISGDQSKLFLFDQSTAGLEVIPLDDIVGTPEPSSNPLPSIASTAVLPVPRLQWSKSPRGLRYEVYFGTDETRVAQAGPGSPEYLGEVADTSIALPPTLTLGGEYFWRVDVAGFGETVKGDVWWFMTAPIRVSPNAIARIGVPGASTPDVTLELTTGGGTVGWSISAHSPWMSVSSNAGTTPETIQIILDTSQLGLGIHSGEVEFTTPVHVFAVPITIELVTPLVTQMETDYTRPYIYALHPDTDGAGDALLLFVNTETETVERAIPIGTTPTDMSINSFEDKLYVTNWTDTLSRVVDLTTQREVEPLPVGSGIYRLNAGQSGKICVEKQEYLPNVWATLLLIDTNSGQTLGQSSLFGGDGEVEPTGTYYYHVDAAVIPSRMSKYDITTNSPVMEANVTVNYGTKRNLVMSGDGQRIFCRTKVYDADLAHIYSLGTEIYATTIDGGLAFSKEAVIETATGEILAELPILTSVMAISGDQEKLFLFDAGTHQFIVMSLGALGAMEVVIDVRPGGEPNPVNCKKENGLIPVAILTTDEFDATTVDHNSVRFGAGEAREYHPQQGAKRADRTSVQSAGANKGATLNPQTRELPISVPGNPNPGGTADTGTVELRLPTVNLDPPPTGKRHEEDVDGDGDVDLLFHFRVGNTGIECGQDSVWISGETFDGQAIMGVDEIKTVPAGDAITTTPDAVLQSLPMAFALHPNIPNPFLSSTIIRYELPEAGEVHLNVYDSRGALIRTVERSQRPPGRYEVVWNGSDDAGRRVAAGVYFYRIKVKGFTATRRMVRLR